MFGIVLICRCAKLPYFSRADAKDLVLSFISSFTFPLCMDISDSVRRANYFTIAIYNNIIMHKLNLYTHIFIYFYVCSGFGVCFDASNSIHVETFKWLAFWVNICERYLHCLFLMFVVSPFCCTISPVIWNSRGYHRDFYLENSLYAAITGNWSKNNLDRLSSFSKNGKFTIDLLSLGMLCMHQDPQFPIADPTFCGAFKTTIRPGWNGEL